MRISVIGAGSWGTTVAAMAARRNPTVLWSRRGELAASVNETGMNTEYLPGVRLPYGLRATSDPNTAVADAEVVIMAVPSHGFRSVYRSLSGGISAGIPVVSLVKGIEQGTRMTMTEVITDEDPRREVVGVLTGPNLAMEVATGQPTAAVIGMENKDAAAAIQQALMDPTFRIYTNTDVVGCELAGALKNVMALAAGMARGLGFGHNTLAALITRALAELTRLGTAMGGRVETFAGLAGMGDLIATCQSDQSRNNRVGMELARGNTLEKITGEMRMVAEGVKTVTPVLELAAMHEVETPIASQVDRVLHEGVHPRDAVLTLMTREAKAEG